MTYLEAIQAILDGKTVIHAEKGSEFYFKLNNNNVPYWYTKSDNKPQMSGLPETWYIDKTFMIHAPESSHKPVKAFKGVDLVKTWINKKKPKIRPSSVKYCICGVDSSGMGGKHSSWCTK